MGHTPNGQAFQLRIFQNLNYLLGQLESAHDLNNKTVGIPVPSVFSRHMLRIYGWLDPFGDEISTCHVSQIRANNSVAFYDI